MGSKQPNTCDSLVTQQCVTDTHVFFIAILFLKLLLLFLFGKAFVLFPMASVFYFQFYFNKASRCLDKASIFFQYFLSFQIDCYWFFLILSVLGFSVKVLLLHHDPFDTEFMCFHF